jgi:hypothetical protein
VGDKVEHHTEEDSLFWTMEPSVCVPVISVWPNIACNKLGTPGLCSIGGFQNEIVGALTAESMGLYPNQSTPGLSMVSNKPRLWLLRLLLLPPSGLLPPESTT